MKFPQLVDLKPWPKLPLYSVADFGLKRYTFWSKIQNQSRGRKSMIIYNQ